MKLFYEPVSTGGFQLRVIVTGVRSGEVKVIGSGTVGAIGKNIS